jgi:hypothetical protein
MTQRRVKAMVEPSQELFLSMIKLFLSGMADSNRAFYQRYGKEALPVIAGVMNDTGAKWGRIMQQSSPNRTMQSVADQWLASGAAMGMGTEIVSVSHNSLHYRQSRCALGLEGTARELCEAMMNIDSRRVSTFLGREVNARILKTLAAGDERCEVVFSTA